MEYVTLNNGVKMPQIGYGTYQTPPRMTEKCVADAIQIGYRSIDTAQCYGNEKEVTVTGVIAPGKACDPALLAEDFWKLYTERKECEIVH